MRVTRRKRHTTICKFCRIEFETSGLNKVCPACSISMDEQFRVIKEYLSKYPNATVAKTCVDLNIPSALLKYYLREDRLEIIGNTSPFLVCDACGKEIISGRVCDACEKRTARADVRDTLAASRDNDKVEREVAKFAQQGRKRITITTHTDKN